MRADRPAVPARRGHFNTESGYHTDSWMDLETLCLRPAAIDPYARQLADRVRRYEVEAVCGPLNEGAFVALMVAAALGCDFTYAERIALPRRDAIFSVSYRLPPPLRPVVRGRRIAIVNDVISAGSAVRGTLADLEACGAVVVVVTALLLLGSAFAEFAQGRGIPLEVLSQTNGNVWPPEDCPLCRSGVPLENHVR